MWVKRNTLGMGCEKRTPIGTLHCLALWIFQLFPIFTRNLKYHNI